MLSHDAPTLTLEEVSLTLAVKAASLASTASHNDYVRACQCGTEAEQEAALRIVDTAGIAFEHAVRLMLTLFHSPR